MGSVPFNSSLALNVIKRIENKAEHRTSLGYLPQPSSRLQLISPNHNDRASVKALVPPFRLFPQEKPSFVKRKGDISEKVI